MPMGRKEEFIVHEAGNSEAWICICGNEPTEDGFYPCDANGNEVHPTVKDWEEPLYVCARCGRIIHQETLKVMGQNPSPQLLQ